MPTHDSISICYLVLFPYTPLRAGESDGVLTSPKDAPYFYNNNIQVTRLPVKEIQLGDVVVSVEAQIFDENVWLAECRYTLSTVLEEDQIVHKNSQIQSELKQLFKKAAHLSEAEISEEYTILVIEEKHSKPDNFVDDHSKLFSSLIRGSYDKPLDRHEVKKILSTKIRYSTQDLSIVDWNGAIILTDDGDFQSDIDLLKIGNYQLMRYRMMDAILDDKFETLKHIVDTPSRFFGFKKEKLLRDIINQRLALLTSFDKLDQSLLLIGDWYSSQLYEAIVKEFYIAEWKAIIQHRLDSLGSIHDVVHQNFTFSWYRLIEFITFIGWFVMMVGYFVLFYFDSIAR